MESLLNAALVLPQWVVFVVVVVVLFVFVLGSTIGSSIIGFGPRVVRRTETFEYGEEEAKNRAPEKQGQPNKRSITTETQTSRTLWDWLTILTISAVIGVVALMFTTRQAEQQRHIQNQQNWDKIALITGDASSRSQNMRKCDVHYQSGRIGTLFRLDDWRAQKIGLQGLWFTPLATKAGKRNGRREYICEVDGPAR